MVNLVTSQLDSDNRLNNANVNELNSFITISYSNFDIIRTIPIYLTIICLIHVKLII